MQHRIIKPALQRKQGAHHVVAQRLDDSHVLAAHAAQVASDVNKDIRHLAAHQLLQQRTKDDRLMRVAKRPNRRIAHDADHFDVDWRSTLGGVEVLAERVAGN